VQGPNAAPVPEADASSEDVAAAETAVKALEKMGVEISRDDGRPGDVSDVVLIFLFCHGS
jgi:hypothetical protein